jgi:hypothetical protein
MPLLLKMIEMISLAKARNTALQQSGQTRENSTTF